MEFKNKKRANHTEIYEELLKEVQKHFNDQEILLIKKAYLMAKDLHRGQKRNSGRTIYNSSSICSLYFINRDASI